jgi:hypothetical protein
MVRGTLQLSLAATNSHVGIIGAVDIIGDSDTEAIEGRSSSATSQKEVSQEYFLLFRARNGPIAKFSDSTKEPSKQ